ncbi:MULTISPECIES: hypothetical protein [Pseudomonas]|uniref:hypothetical protein n=1 Tax=Pseudomonas TaxID=286 RepID=UPI0007C66243|nr:MULTISPECIES: hypothetical protein [Pseudomonas]MDD2124166.1 hypothetical protein [Pseudomonas monteilii]
MNSKSSTTAVTTSQLADLCAVTPAAIRHHTELPRIPVHGPAPGRPEHAIALAALAQFAFDQTAHLTEAEVRLRLALAGRTEPRRLRSKHGKVGPFYLTPNPDGTYQMRPLLCPNDLTFDEQLDLKAAITTEQQP